MLHIDDNNADALFVRNASSKTNVFEHMAVAICVIRSRSSGTQASRSVLSRLPRIARSLMIISSY